MLATALQPTISRHQREEALMVSNNRSNARSVIATSPLPAMNASGARSSATVKLPVKDAETCHWNVCMRQIAAKIRTSLSR
jgi:hypothetical protein